MNISPILLLVIGSAFAIFYGLIITVGWAITRKNRKSYHKAMGYSEVEMIDLSNFKPLGLRSNTISLYNNLFVTENDTPIDIENYKSYIVKIPSSNFPKINKGDLILMEPSSNKIKYVFKIPDLKNFR